MPIRPLEAQGPQVRPGLREIRTAPDRIRAPRYVPVIVPPEQRPVITILNPVLLKADEDSADEIKPSVGLDTPRFGIMVRNNNLRHSLTIARGLACLTDRLLLVSGLTRTARFTIDYGRDVLRSTINISKGEITLSQFVLRRFHDPSTMGPEQRARFDIDCLAGRHETDLDEINVAFIIGHEIAHLKQYSGIFGFFNKLLRFFGPYNRRLEYRADGLAADYLLQLGYRDPIRAFQQATRLVKDIWSGRTHPTLEERQSRMEKYLRNRLPAIPQYPGESFAELSQLYS